MSKAKTLRLISLLLAVVMLFALTACGGDKGGESSAPAGEDVTTTTDAQPNEGDDGATTGGGEDTTTMADGSSTEGSTNDTEGGTTNKTTVGNKTTTANDKKTTANDKKTTANDKKTTTNNKKTTKKTSRTIAANAGTVPQGINKVDPTKEQIISIKALKDPKITETKIDLKGATVKVGSYLEFTEAYSDWFGGREDYYAAQLKKVEKDYNCKIEWVPIDMSNYADAIISAKAAGIIPAHIFFGWYPDLINAGVLADLRTVASVNMGGNEWNAAAVLGCTFNNKIYGVRAGDPVGQMLWFNKTMAEEYDLGNFYDLVLKKKWTFDKFVEICQEIYNKSNHTLYGIGAYYRSDINNFVLANGTNAIAIKNGKAVYNGTDSKVLEALKLATLPGVFNPQANYTEAWRGRTALINGEVLFSLDHQSAASALNNHMSDDYGCIPLPMGPNTDTYTHVIQQTPGQVWSLFDEDPEIEKHGAVMTALANRCRTTVAMYDEQMRAVLRDEESLQMLHYALGEDIPLKRSALVPVLSSAFEQIMTGQQTPSQAMQAIKNSVGAQLNEYYNEGGGKAFWEPV